MDRRTDLTSTAASGMGLAMPSAEPQVQQSGQIYRIGVLQNRTNPSPETESLRAGLAQLGYVDGTNVVYEIRAAEGQLDRLPGFAAELVGKGVDVLVTYGGPPTNEARLATTTIPIVEGALAVSDRVHRVARVRQVTVVDPAGAGDAFAGGFLCGYLEGGVQRGLEIGSALGALHCTILGDFAYITRAEVEALLASDDDDIQR